MLDKHLCVFFFNIYKHVYILHCDLIFTIIQVFTWNKVICMYMFIVDETGGQHNEY